MVISVSRLCLLSGLMEIRWSRSLKRGREKTTSWLSRKYWGILRWLCLGSSKLTSKDCCMRILARATCFSPGTGASSSLRFFGVMTTSTQNRTRRRYIQASGTIWARKKLRARTDKKRTYRRNVLAASQAVNLPWIQRLRISISRLMNESAKRLLSSIYRRRHMTREQKYGHLGCFCSKCFDIRSLHSTRKTELSK